MKTAVLAIIVLTGLLGQDVMATVVGHEVNEVMLTAELSFAAASLYMGLSNAFQGYDGNHSLPASLFGLAVGVTSLVLSTSSDAEVPALDVGTGILAVVGSVFRLPRSQEGPSQQLRSDGPKRSGLDFELLTGLRHFEIRVDF